MWASVHGVVAEWPGSPVRLTPLVESVRCRDLDPMGLPAFMGGA
jgi:hypothetical protein